MAMQKFQIVSAWDLITALINKIDLPQNIKMEAREAADLLRKTAESALPKTGPMTATELDARAGKAEIIAQGDDLATLTQLLPYMIHRRELARQYNHRPDDLMLGAIDKVNQKISELLNFF